MENLLTLIILLAVLAGLAALVKGFLSRRSPTLGEFPYQKKAYLLTEAERSFYKVLRRVAGDELHVFAKVRLADLVWLPKGTKHRQAHLNRVLSKHVDFVLCHRQTVAPVLVVELDDSSHESSRRQERDAFVNQVLRTTGLPLLRVPAKRAYVPNELAELIRKEIEPRAISLDKGRSVG